jgi:uncharacterized LabA/DUF88 family protein
VGKNVAVFVDVANIFYAAKAAGVDIDYVTLLKSATAGRDLVRAYAYTGLDPDNENQRNFHDFLRRSNYKVVSKDIRKYGDGKVKANLDIELVVDMMKTARNLDIAIVVSGDGDFAPAIRAVQEQGVRVEVVSFRGNTSSDLIDVADQFTDIVQLARVEKGSRSGRRIAEDESDLSMTEVPDKLTEGTGTGRGGRGRGRGRTAQEEPVAIGRGRGRGRPSVDAPAAVAAAGAAPSGGLVALPGERLSRAAGGLTEADLAAAEVFTLDDVSNGTPGAAEPIPSPEGQGDEGEGEPRRRRRRGGRGRGRGRARADELADELEVPADEAVREPRPSRPGRDVDEADEEIVPTRRPPRTTPFGSVWDSQLGTPVAPSAASLAPVGDDEDFDEPEIPEYLIAEQRRGANRGAGRGPRGGRSAYQSAMERERYGRSGGGGGARSGGGRGINRYPDVSARPRPATPPREERGYGRGDRAPAPRSSAEPWSDVPPELEALLRAQVAQKPAPKGPGRGRAAERPKPSEPVTPVVTEPEASTDAIAEVAAPTRAGRRPSTRTPRGAGRATEATGAADVVVEGAEGVEAAAAPKRRTSRSTKAPAAEPAAVAVGESGEAIPETLPAPRPTRAAAKPKATRKPAATKAAKTAASPAATDGDAASDVAAAVVAPKRRSTRKATPTEPA